MDWQNEATLSQKVGMWDSRALLASDLTWLTVIYQDGACVYSLSRLGKRRPTRVPCVLAKKGGSTRLGIVAHLDIHEPDVPCHKKECLTIMLMAWELVLLEWEQSLLWFALVCSSSWFHSTITGATLMAFVSHARVGGQRRGAKFVSKGSIEQDCEARVDAFRHIWCKTGCETLMRAKQTR